MIEFWIGWEISDVWVNLIRFDLIWFVNYKLQTKLNCAVLWNNDPNIFEQNEIFYDYGLVCFTILYKIDFKHS